MSPPRDARPRPGPARTIIGLVVLAIVAGAGAWVWYSRFARPVSEDQVQAMITRRELVGLPVQEAARRLGHRAPPTEDGLVLLDFEHVRGWRAGSVMLDVEKGRVVVASWAPSVLDGAPGLDLPEDHNR